MAYSQWKVIFAAALACAALSATRAQFEEDWEFGEELDFGEQEAGLDAASGGMGSAQGQEGVADPVVDPKEELAAPDAVPPPPQKDPQPAAAATDLTAAGHRNNGLHLIAHPTNVHVTAVSKEERARLDECFQTGHAIRGRTGGKWRSLKQLLHDERPESFPLHRRRFICGGGGDEVASLQECLHLLHHCTGGHPESIKYKGPRGVAKWTFGKGGTLPGVLAEELPDGIPGLPITAP